MRKFVRQNSLGLFFGVIFLLALVGQALPAGSSSTTSSSPRA